MVIQVTSLQIFTPQKRRISTFYRSAQRRRRGCSIPPEWMLNLRGRGAQSRAEYSKSALGRAIHYLLEQWPYLTRYLEDGRLELSNNRAERSIKPFVMGRKNWLFANTPGGAQASAVIYSLIETAKENGLDPYRYLLWVLRNAPQLSETGKAWAEKLLPANAPEECCMPQK